MGLGVSEVYGLKILGLHQAMCVGMMWKEAGRARVSLGQLTFSLALSFLCEAIGQPRRTVLALLAVGKFAKIIQVSNVHCPLVSIL